MLVYMFGTVCNRDYILRAGNVYDMSRTLAKKILALRLVTNAAVKKDKDGKDMPGVYVHESLCAEEYDPAKHGKKKVLKVTRPDPEDNGPDADDEFETVE